MFTQHAYVIVTIKQIKVGNPRRLWQNIVRKRQGSYMNYTYILECKDGSFYTGWTNNLEKRIKDHNDGKGAKYTKSRRPVALLYYETFETKEEAMRREYAIKHMTRLEKEKLISQNLHTFSTEFSIFRCKIKK